MTYKTMNSEPKHPDPTAIRARLIRWPSAATCAFLASGLEIFWSVLSRWQLSRLIESAGLVSQLVIVEFSYVLAVAVEAVALWGIGRRQQAVAPTSARLGQWAVVTHVVMSVLLVLTPLISALNLGVWSLVLAYGAQFLTAGNWAIQVVMIPLTLAFGCLGWASRGGAGRRQQWASSGLLALATFSVLHVVWKLFGLPTGHRSMWLAFLHVALSAATWAAIGVWLRSAPIVAPQRRNLPQ
jgi:hypothetical protein